ncbi:AAA family ATPase [Qipengyuania sp.]|uniref:nSTAND1 domain-containing NTPase n=1 Tax=Qipengyuania sp. TaxID=2004515 RepID=UPI0035C7AB88
MNWFSKLIGRQEVSYDPGTETLPFRNLPVSKAAVDDSDLPSFRNRAGRKSHRAGDRATSNDARALIRDAFTPSQPVNERAMFAGRRHLLEDLIVAIEDQRLHFVLYGDRGIGKTSILHVLSDIASDADYLVCYISCGDRMSFSDFARRVAARIPLLYHKDYGPGSAEIEKGLMLSDLLAEGEVDVSTFGEMLGKLSNTRLLMLLDEFDRVETDEFRRSIAELIKTLSDSAAPAQVVIAGVAPDLSELIAQIPSIRRNVLGVLVPNMSDEEVNEMLDIAGRRTGLTFQDDARELIGLASLGLPYLVGLVAQHASLLVTADGEMEVTKAAVREAIRKAHSELSGRIAAKTLYAISRALQEGQLIELGKLAHAALRSGGVLPDEMVPDFIRQQVEGGKFPALIEPVEGDPLNRWHFTDDGASIYIWLNALCAD